MRSTQKTHWFLISVYTEFVQAHPQAKENPDNEQLQDLRIQGSKKLNILITPTRKQIRSKDMDDIRQLALAKLRDKYNVQPQEVSEFIIENVSYLGLMSEIEYFDET